MLSGVNTLFHFFSFFFNFFLRLTLLSRQHFPQKASRIRRGVACDGFGGSTHQHLPAAVSTLGTEVNDPISRLGFLVDVGLDYISLDRRAETLSGGEAQRIRLASQIGSGLVGVMYILDEPSIGLHQRDNERLLKTLRHLRDLGNTVIVVEHDEDAIRAADYVLDLGPGAGVHGGEIVAQGKPQEIMLPWNVKKLTYIAFIVKSLS